MKEITIKKMAKALGISQPYLSEIFRGRHPARELAIRLAERTSGWVPAEMWLLAPPEKIEKAVRLWATGQLIKSDNDRMKGDL